MNITLNQITNIEVDGVDTKDYPDFCDAFISYCEVDGTEATDDQLDYINNNFCEVAQEEARDHCLGMI